MVDPLIVTNAINTAVSTATQIATLAGKIKNHEMESLVADLKLEIAQIKTTMAGLIDENRQLKTAIAVNSVPKVQPFLKNDMYYVGDDGPYCIKCFHDDETLVPLTLLTGGNTIFGKYVCSVCQRRYGEPKYS